jgi:hypothetical protein
MFDGNNRHLWHRVVAMAEPLCTSDIVSYRYKYLVFIYESFIIIRHLWQKAQRTENSFHDIIETFLLRTLSKPNVIFGTKLLHHHEMPLNGVFPFLN